MEFQKFLLEDYMLTKEGRRMTRFFKDFSGSSTTVTMVAHSTARSTLG